MKNNSTQGPETYCQTSAPASRRTRPGAPNRSSTNCGTTPMNGRSENSGGGWGTSGVGTASSGTGSGVATGGGIVSSVVAGPCPAQPPRPPARPVSNRYMAKNCLLRGMGGLLLGQTAVDQMHHHGGAKNRQG